MTRKQTKKKESRGGPHNNKEKMRKDEENTIDYKLDNSLFQDVNACHVKVLPTSIV